MRCIWPAGELVGAPLAVALEPHEPQRLGHAPVALGALDLGDAQAERHVVGDVEVRKQRRPLEDHVERAPVGQDPRDVGIAEQHAAHRGPLEAGDDAQQRRLAAARGPEHRHELALPEGQADVVERHHRAEAVRDVLDGDGRRLLAHSGTTSATRSSPLAALRRAARRANRNATSQSTSVTVMSSVETTLIDGSTVRRSCDQM